MARRQLTDREIEFEAILNRTTRSWEAAVTIPYSKCYAAAFNSFKDKLGEQRAKDEANAQMLVTALSIVSGTVLMAAVATASLRVLAGRAVQSICKTNLNTTFGLLKIVNTLSHNEAAIFAVGKVLDEAKDKLGKAAQDVVTSLVASSGTIVSDDPLIQSLTSRQLLVRNAEAASKMAAVIEHMPGLAEQHKATAFAALRRAPIANEPGAQVVEDKLKLKIELAMYMQMILNSDSLVEVPFKGYGEYPNPFEKLPSKPIEISPNAGNYPKSEMPKAGWTGMSAYKTVSIERPGDIVRKQIDDLCHTVIGKKFYATDFKGNPNVRNHLELRAAEAVLFKIGNLARPKNLQDVSS